MPTKHVRMVLSLAAAVVLITAVSCEKKKQENVPPDRAEMRRRFMQLRDSLGSDSAAVAVLRQRYGGRGGPGGGQPGMHGINPGDRQDQTGQEGVKPGEGRRSPQGQPVQGARQHGQMLAGQQPRGGAALIPVEVSRIQQRDMTDYILASTTLEALREIEVFSKTTGIVEELRVEEGDAVAAGDTLIVLDEREARLNHRKAEISFKEAENALNRSREMKSRNLISQEDFETALLAHENALTSLGEARLALEYTRVTAPIGGTITHRSVELGTMVTQGKALFRLADFNPLRARIYIPEKELRRLHVGQRVVLGIESVPEREFDASVTLISSVVDPSSGTFKVTVEVESAGGILRPGMFASARIIVDTHPQTRVVQAEAVLYDGKQRYLYVIREGAAERVDVEAGFIDKGCVEVLGPVEEGEMVVVAGHNNLASGTKVEVVREVGGKTDARDVKIEAGTAQKPQSPGGRSN
ncbi:MAG: efflux RND transporter periplasmic adaptor subunit [bacterium]|nr:MAG: efflux RND transporter periplasmic adaptor subunit [bacterium]